MYPYCFIIKNASKAHGVESTFYLFSRGLSPSANYPGLGQSIHCWPLSLNRRSIVPQDALQYVDLHSAVNEDCFIYSH